MFENIRTIVRSRSARSAPGVALLVLGLTACGTEPDAVVETGAESPHEVDSETPTSSTGHEAEAGAIHCTTPERTTADHVDLSAAMAIEVDPRMRFPDEELRLPSSEGMIAAENADLPAPSPDILAAQDAYLARVRDMSRAAVDPDRLADELEQAKSEVLGR